MPYNNIINNFPDGADQYMDEVIIPTYYPSGHANLDKKWLKLWLCPDLNAMDDGGLNFSPQFWGETAYGIILNEYIGFTDGVLPDAIPLSQFKSLTADRRNEATDWGEKLNAARAYSTYAPAIIGYDPVNDGYFGGLASRIGGTSSVSAHIRDSAHVPYSLPPKARLHLYSDNGVEETFSYMLDGYDSSNEYSGYTNPPCFRDESHPDTTQMPDLHVYFVICLLSSSPPLNDRYCARWVIYSESQNYYRIVPAVHTLGGANLPFGEPTNEPEGDEPEVPIPIPSLPTADISGCGVKLFRDGNGFNELMHYMWGTSGLDAIRKLIGDETPYECIVGFNLFPYADALSVGDEESIYIGNVNTGVVKTRTNQFGLKDFGYATIDRKFHNALDFAPYTVVELFLPFIGKVKLPTDFVMGKTIGVTYHMDCLTGGCFAYISTTTDGVIQCEGGSCLIQLPIMAKTADGVRQAISSAMGAGVSFAMAGGMSSKIGQVGSAMGGIEQAANAIAAKDSYTTFGGMSLANGYLGLSNPILYIHRPINATPSGYNTIMGYAASTIQQLSSLTGFTQVKEINLGVAGASKEDLDEIEALLKEGVIL